MSDCPLGLPPQGTDASAWNHLYEIDDAGWDLGQASPALCWAVDQAWFQSLSPGTALIPGCGRAWDAEPFVTVGWRILGVDIAPMAIEQARQRFEPETAIELRAADALHLNEHIDLFIDHTFFCALVPDQRQAWVDCLARCVKPHGYFLGVHLRTSFSNRQPFDCEPELYDQLLEQAGFVIEQSIRLEAESHKRRRGRERLVLARKR